MNAKMILRYWVGTLISPLECFVVVVTRVYSCKVSQLFFVIAGV